MILAVTARSRYRLMNLLAFPTVLLLAGCLDFGGKEEALAPNVTAAHIDQIERITKLRLPAGSHGLAFLYDGSGIDAALAAKLKIPSDKVTELMAQDVFAKGRTDSLIQGIGPGSKWWHPESLTSPVTRSLSTGQFLGCILGREGSDDVLYISWFDT